MMKRLYTIAVLGLTLCAIPAPDAEAVDRQGFLIGFSLGYGGAKCDDADCATEWGGAADFHIGAMLKENVALMYDSHVVTFDSEGVTFTTGVSGVAVQFWPSNQFWVKGGVGLGVLSCDQDCSTETGFGVLAGAGVELVQKTKFVLDLQGRYSLGKFDNGNVSNYSVTLGFNWY